MGAGCLNCKGSEWGDKMLQMNRGLMLNPKAYSRKDRRGTMGIVMREVRDLMDRVVGVHRRVVPQPRQGAAQQQAAAEVALVALFLSPFL